MRRFLIIILVILLVWAGIYIFYVKPRQNSTTTPVPTVLKPFFPSSTGNNSLSDGTIPGVLGTNPTTQNTNTTNNQFKQLTDRAIAGYTTFDISSTVSVPATNPNPSSTKATAGAAKSTIKTVVDHYIRYVSRQNGYVYEIKDGGAPLQITNVFLPNVYEAYFIDNNNTVIERFLRDDQKTIATYSIPIPPVNPDGTRTQLGGTYLPDNIFEIAISPDQKQLLRLTTDKTGAVLTSSTSIGTQIKTLLRSPFTEWIPSWIGNTVYMQTKAASVATGFLYSVDQPSARLRRIVGDITGLTASISPTGTYVLYSQSNTSNFNAFLLNTKTSATTPIDLAILPEKCVWLQNENIICAGNNVVPNAVYPDAWYAGTVHFSDQLYQINSATHLYTVLYNGQNQSFDITNLRIDENQRLVYFIDKTSGYLWSFGY